MDKPRLIYYNDGHHFNAKRIEPPASIHMLQWPVDEVAGTGVDLLVLGLGYGDVYFHDSKVGRVVGQQKEVWESYIDWRIMRMVEEARKLGTDQVREVIKRGKELGIRVFPSLKLQDVAPPGGERCGLLKGERGAEVCIGAEGMGNSAVLGLRPFLDHGHLDLTYIKHQASKKKANHKKINNQQNCKKKLL